MELSNLHRSVREKLAKPAQNHEKSGRKNKKAMKIG